MIKVSVTTQHIHEGTPKSGQYCPIALACKDAGIPNPSVHYPVFCYGPLQIEILANGNYKLHYQYRTTPTRSMVRFMRRFDQNKPVEPFNFILKDVTI